MKVMVVIPGPAKSTREATAEMRLAVSAKQMNSPMGFLWCIPTLSKPWNPVARYTDIQPKPMVENEVGYTMIRSHLDTGWDLWTIRKYAYVGYNLL